MKRSTQFFTIVGAISLAGVRTAHAGITVEPFVTVSSTKSIKPKGSGQEEENVKQRNTYGVRGSVSFFRLFKLGLSLGQNETINTVKTQKAVDEFAEIDIKADANLDTSSADKEAKITEVQRIGRVTVSIDPSFWIFILRVQAGVQARQRFLKVEENAEVKARLAPGPTYAPLAKAGLGIRFTPRTYFIMDYGFIFPKFPETEPFECEVGVAFSVSI